MFNLSNDHPALIDGDTGHITTYRELQAASQAFPVKKKSLIFLFNKNKLPDMVSYVCAINSGSAVCLLDGNMPAQFKQQLVNTYFPDYIYSDEEQWENYSSISTGFYQSKKNGPTVNNQLQLLLSTSGTTGNPKLIRLSKENVLSNANSIIEYLEINAEERAIASLPIHYSYGLSVLHTHLLAGASIVLTQASIAQNPFWEILNRFKCTSLAGVPYTYKVMERIGFLGMELPSLHTLTQAGGKLEAALILKFQQKIPRFFVMYGQTEATARIAFLPPRYLPQKAGSIGMAIPGGELTLVDDGKEVTTSGTAGELVYQGPNVMLGYADNAEDLAKGDDLHGILHTGDLGYFDADHLFYLTGRLKRISKIYGLRINLDDIENELSLLAIAAATAADEQICLYVENGSQKTCDQCVAHLAKLYSLHPSTFRCLSIPELPRTASGKINYKELK